MGLRDRGLLFALSALWGGSFFFVGVAMRELPPLSIVTLRVRIAVLVLLAIVRARRSASEGSTDSKSGIAGCACPRVQRRSRLRFSASTS
jgi:hypothetical protein